MTFLLYERNDVDAYIEGPTCYENRILYTNYK